MSELGLGLKEPLLPEKKKSPLSKDVSAEPDSQILDKLRDIELLPDLFTLIQSLEKGELQPKDFDNNAGNIRLKVNTVRQYLLEIEGICESVAERESKIQTIRQCNGRKVEFLELFRKRVLKDLDQPRSLIGGFKEEANEVGSGYN